MVKKTVSLRGAELEVVEQGTGEPVVLVHGSASDYRTWLQLMDELSDRYRVIAYSRRYHWPNQPIEPDTDYNMLEHVLDLGALLPAVKAAPAHLVGHSYGAFLCLLLAIEAPGLVRSLTLAEPPVTTLYVSDPPRPQELLKLLRSRPRTALAIARFGATGLAPATMAARAGNMDTAMNLFGRAVLGKKYFQKMSEERLGQVRANAIREEFCGSGFAPLDAQEVKAINVPTLLVGAEESPSIFHYLLDGLEELLPKSERVEIPAASHDVHEKNPSAFLAAARRFLDRQSRQTEQQASAPT